MVSYVEWSQNPANAKQKTSKIDDTEKISMAPAQENTKILRKSVKMVIFKNLIKDSKTRANLQFDSGIKCGMEPQPCSIETKNLKTRSF